MFKSPPDYSLTSFRVLENILLAPFQYNRHNSCGWNSNHYSGVLGFPNSLSFDKLTTPLASFEVEVTVPHRIRCTTRRRKMITICIKNLNYERWVNVINCRFRSSHKLRKCGGIIGYLSRSSNKWLLSNYIRNKGR